ncbi:hypothetical protein D9Q98_005993 [Chlorella vulgaris]|uniref:Non-structural maintenance of chromosomes element 4 n=1 Tax=Chlorella vulgaris TaxID=3077 RepID=A0A9D4Z1G4_CHLVU|nr:hypothetical protein D9Q98_005993 [Chlorella vulgaris]
MGDKSQQEQKDADKELRSGIRGLMAQTKNGRCLAGSDNQQHIVDVVQRSNHFVGQVTRPRDQALESELFSLVTEQARDALLLQNRDGRTYNAGDFLRRLKTRYVADTDAQQAGAEDPEAFNWAALGQLPVVTVLFRSVPVVHHLLGPLDSRPRQPRQVAARQAKRRAPVGEAVRPDEVEDAGADGEKQETDRNMEEMWGVLKAQQGGRACLLDLVMNRASFAQTVENLFSLSFLVRDNKVALEEDEEEGIVVVQRGAAKPDVKERGGEAEKNQFVIPVDMETWEMWKQVTDTSRPPMMKHRKEAAQHAQQAQRQQTQQAHRQGQQQQQQQQEPLQAQQQQQQQQQAVEDVEEVDEEVVEPPRQRQRTQQEQPAQRRRSAGGSQQRDQQQAQQREQQREPLQEQQQEQRPVNRQPPRQAQPAVKLEAGVAVGSPAAAGAAVEFVDLCTSTDEDERSLQPQPSRRQPTAQAVKQARGKPAVHPKAKLMSPASQPPSATRVPARGKRAVRPGA